MQKKRRFTAPAALALSLALLGTVPAYAATDISGHWAEATINKWLDAGSISGYEDGTFTLHPPIGEHIRN